MNNGSGSKPSDISVGGNTIESVDSFVISAVYGQYRTHLTCRIGLTWAVMKSLKWIWSDKHLTLDTKLHIYQTLALSVLLYATDT